MVITFPDGNKREFPHGVTIKEVASSIGQRLGKDAIGGRIGNENEPGNLIDVHTPITSDCHLRIVTVNTDEGLEVLRHSTAHLMASAVQRLFPESQVTIGPAVADGFYYDFERKEAFTPADFAAIEAEMARLAKLDLPLQRQVVSRAEAAKLFSDLGQHYKVEILNAIAENEPITLYRHGDWVDLCRGPHVPSTGYLKAFKLTKVAGAYWRGDEKNPMLQRLYGTAFWREKDLIAHFSQLEEAAKRDHRKVGVDLELFFFHPLAPAMPFFLPKGAFIYNQLVGLARRYYEVLGFQEVITPQVFDTQLFAQSGHLANYQENMYFCSAGGGGDAAAAAAGAADGAANPAGDQASAAAGAGGENPAGGQAAAAGGGTGAGGAQWALKPMNCPGHTLLYSSTLRSYRDLPLRYADFGRLHRYERSGVTAGLTRVRSFSQDDAHIFCRQGQIEDEILQQLNMLQDMYRLFDFTMRVQLSTRPQRSLGRGEDITAEEAGEWDGIWHSAEKHLQDALNNSGIKYTVNPGDGAFYGPKIDCEVQDALGRHFQLGTIQLDFGLPRRFNLTYQNEAGKKDSPVMVHRAVFGSLERFIGILLEHTAGDLPVWLLPEQVRLVTVVDEASAWGDTVAAALRQAGVRVHKDAGAHQLGYKIRQAELNKIPFVLVLGAKEVQNQTVTLRQRKQKAQQQLNLDEAVQLLSQAAAAPALFADRADSINSGMKNTP